MAISQETKTVVKKTTFICDMLFKEVERDEVHTIYGNHCISKEAVRRLPEDVSKNKIILKYTLYGSGQEKDGFQPEWLHKGIWALEVPTSEYGFVAKLTNNNNPGDCYGNRQFAKEDNPSCFKTYEDAMDWIEKRCKQWKDADFRYWVFSDGKLLQAFKTIAVPIPVTTAEEEEED